MSRKELVPLNKSNRGEDLTARRVGKVPSDQKVTVTVGLSGPELPDPSQFVGKNMSIEELERNFSANRPDAVKVKEVLEKKFGLKVERVSPKTLKTRSMRVSGTAKNMEAAFDPQWELMHSPTQGFYRARKGEIKIPKELKGIVTGVFGLDQRIMARPRSGGAVSAHHENALRTLKLAKPLAPADIEKLYNFPPGNGEGQTIAIAQFGGGYFKEDIEEYCRQVGRKPPKIQLIPAGAKVYTLKDILNIPNPELRFSKIQQSFEVMMDVEIIAGLCPKANISVYFAESTQEGWRKLLDEVIHTRPTPVALSISWGMNEDDGWEEVAIEEINQRLNKASAAGITTCVASGDDGCRCGCEVDNCQLAHVDFPSSSEFVLAVGGTMLGKYSTDVKEVAWRENPVKIKSGKPLGGGARYTPVGGGATGGGVSTKNRRPAWQKNLPFKLYNNERRMGRVVPDVSALAGKPYHKVVFLQLPWPQGKTSASAPVWAALIARINAKLPPNKRQRFLTPLLYKEWKQCAPIGKAAFFNISKGNNAVANFRHKHYARKRFDALTGWGVPNGRELLKCLKKNIPVSTP